MKLGPKAQDQMARLGRVWKQGQFVLVSGVPGSGKTVLARSIVEQRIARRGFVMVMVMKLTPDPTILTEYKGWTRWTRWQNRPGPSDNRVLLWPKLDRIKTIAAKRAHQQAVFGEAFDKLTNVGRWTIQVDEGLYTVAPSFLNLGDPLGMLHAMGRASDLSIVTLTQRPAHLPLILYSSASHAFVGRTREEADRKRLAELGGREGSRELARMVSEQSLHEFRWLPVAVDWPSELVDLTK